MPSRLSKKSLPKQSAAQLAVATLDERIRRAHECLALVTLALHANMNAHLGEGAVKINPDLIFNATDLAAELAADAWGDLVDIDLPRPLGNWREDLTDEDLIAALQAYAQGGREILSRADKAEQRRKIAGAR